MCATLVAMKPRTERTTYLSTLFQKYGIEPVVIAKATGATREATRHWVGGRSFPVAHALPAIVKLLRKYEPSLSVDVLLARENAVAKPRSGRGKAKAGK